MSHDLDQLLRERLGKYAEPIAADEAWRNGVINRLEPVRIRHQRTRVAQAGIAAAAAVVGLVAGVALVRAQDGPDPAPAPSPPDTNRGVIERMPEGDAADVLVLDETGRVLFPDGRSVDVGRDTGRRILWVIGRHGDQVIVATKDDPALMLVPSGRALGDGSFSPDGALLWNYQGEVSDVATGEVVARTAPFPEDGRDYFMSRATWTAGGVVVSAWFNTTSGEPGTQHMLLPSDPAAAGRLAQDWVEIDWPDGEDYRDPLFASESDRFLFRHLGECAYVATLDSRGAFDRVREMCDPVLAFSPDGSTVLSGVEGDLYAGGDARAASALIDVDTGEVTELPGLAGLDDFDKNVLDIAWEDGDTVLLAYMVERLAETRPDEAVVPHAVVRLVRCRLGDSSCEAVPGEIRTNTAVREVFTRDGVGE